MDTEEFFKLFHASVAAVENGNISEIDLDVEGDGGLEINVTIRHDQLVYGMGPAESG